MAAVSAASVQAIPAPCTVSVVYKEQLQRSDLYREVACIDKPSVIFWYMLKDLYSKGASYYKKDLAKIQPVAGQCYLYDLTAWAATKSKTYSITDCNANADRINKLAIPKIVCEKSSGFFAWLQTCKGAELEYIRKVILQRQFIFKLSATVPTKGITVAELFQNKCPVLESIYKMDAENAYSALQYLEGIYLIRTIIGQEPASSPAKVSNVVFALFNNESEYYRDNEGSFAKDLSAMLDISFGSSLAGRKINIAFYNVNYGTRDGKGVAKEAIWCRPYIETSDIIQVVAAAKQIFESDADVKAAKQAKAAAAKAAKKANGAAASVQKAA